MAANPNRFQMDDATLQARLEKKGVTPAQIQRGADALPDLTPKTSLPPIVLQDVVAREYLRPPVGGDVGMPDFELFCRRTGYQPGQVIEFPLSVSRPHPYGPRRLYDEEELAALRSNIEQEGQLVPVHVIADIKNRCFTFCDGERRRRALLKAGKPTVRAIVIDRPTVKELYKTAYDLNEERAAQTPFDNALAWKALLDDGHADREELMAIVGCSDSNFSKTLALASLPESLMLLMTKDPASFGLGIAYEVALYFKAWDEASALAFVNKISLEKLSYRDVLRLRKAKVSQPTETAPVSKITRQRYEHSYPLKVSGDDAGELKTYADGRIDLRLTKLDPDKQQRFVDAVQRALAEL